MSSSERAACGGADDAANAAGSGPTEFSATHRGPDGDPQRQNDFFFPTETSQKPFFPLPGVPDAHERYSLHEGGHNVLRTQLISETLA